MSHIPDHRHRDTDRSTSQPTNASADTLCADAGRLPDKVPLTDAQQEKWLGAHYSTEAAQAFTEAFELLLEGDVDTLALAAAFTRVVARHEALAMQFPADGSGQVYAPPSQAHMQLIDLSGHGDPYAAYQHLYSEYLNRPFDLESGDTVRVVLCHLAPLRARLLLIAHHLVLDGWSMRIALQELAHFYNAALAGRTASLQWPAARSWRRFVLDQHAHNLAQTGRATLDYWLQRYRDLPEPLALPTDRPRGASICFAAASLQLPVAAPLWKRLKARARQWKVTRFNLLLCGYAVLLHRLAGQNDLVFGIPYSRAAQAGARMLGDTDNTLPLRIVIDPEATLSDTATDVRALLDEAAEHQDTSLGRIVQALELKRNAGRFLLTELAFSLVPAIGKLDFHGLDCVLKPLPRQFMAWEIALHWLQNPSDAVLEVHYRSDLFDAATIDAWMRSYLLVLEQIADGDKAIRETALVLPNSMPMAAGEVVAVPPLLALFDSALRKHAERIAAECAGERISYRQLNAQSTAIALALQAQGIGQGDRVGLSLPRSLQMLAALLGVLRAGAAYVPLDREFPVERLGYMVAQSELQVIVSAPGGQLPESVTRELRVIDVAALIENGSELAAAGHTLVSVPPDALAYILFTSGSTGQPKGVRIRHDNLANLLLAMRHEPGFSASDTLLAVTTLSFDISALELYLPLICGGKTVIAEDAAVGDPLAMCELLTRQRVTVLQTTPALVSLLLEVHRHEVLAGLRLLLGGEALPPALASRLLPLCGELWNLYGPTETTVWSMVARIVQVDGAIPIGQPIANTRIYALDAQRRLLPDGAIGELWIAGKGVADGYQNLADATADRFVRDPFAADGSMMYRTGDLGRRRGGMWYFEGRVDHQIKLRGYRIEPGDIEAAAAGEAGVRECVALLREVQGDQRLVLYLTPRGDDAGLADRVRARLAEHLPRYMRPQHLVVLDQLPMTANAKIDRARLPSPQQAETTDESGEAIDSQLVRELCELWRETLGVPVVRGDDDFFALGGDSLLAVRVFSALNVRYGVNLPLAALLENSTCNELAALIQRQQTIVQHAPVAALPELLESLVLLNKARAGVPLFFIHAIGGHVLNYRALANGLNVPAFGLQSREVVNGDAGERSIEEMAGDYLQQIRRVQPHGPYRLAGGSMGGLVAFAIAQQLHEAGEGVELLALFDTYAPLKAIPINASVFEAAMIRVSWWFRMAVLSALGLMAFVRNRITPRKASHPSTEAGLIRQLGLSSAGETGLQARIARAQANNHRAIRRYRATPLAGNLYLVLANTGIAHRFDSTLGWKRLINGKLSVDRIKSQHENLIESPLLLNLLQARLAPAPAEHE